MIFLHLMKVFIESKFRQFKPIANNKYWYNIFLYSESFIFWGFFSVFYFLGEINKYLIILYSDSYFHMIAD